MNPTKPRLTILPFFMTVVIIVLDQITKLLILRNIEPNFIGPRLFGDFIWIVHARNLGIAFSIGDGFPVLLRRILFIALPLFVMIFVVVYYFRGSDLTTGMAGVPRVEWRR